MSIYSETNIEKLVEKINERHEHLIKKLRGASLSEHDHKIHDLSYPHTRVNAQDLRIAIDDFSVILKEVKRYAK